MPRSKPTPRYPFWLKGTVILFGIGMLLLLFIYGKFILMPLALSALLAMLLEPLSQWCEKLRLGRAVAIILSLIIAIVFIAGVFSLLSLQFMQFADQLPEVGDRLQSLRGEIIHFFDSTFGIAPERQLNFLQQGLQKVIDGSGEYATRALGVTTSVFTTLGLLPIFIFFMMYYKKMYHTFLLKVWKHSNYASIESVIKGVQSVTRNYLVGLMMVIGILATLNFIGLLILGLDNALFFAIFAAVLAVIPYIGIIIGSAPALLYALLFYDSLFMPFGVIIVFALVQFMEGNFITPNIIGSKVSINPFMALIALLVGGQVWGIVGMIIFVPFIGILKCVFDEVPELRPYGYLLGNQIHYEKRIQKDTEE